MDEQEAVMEAEMVNANWLPAPGGAAMTRQFIPQKVITPVIGLPGVSIAHDLAYPVWIEVDPFGAIHVGEAARWTLYQNSGYSGPTSAMEETSASLWRDPCGCLGDEDGHPLLVCETHVQEAQGTPGHVCLRGRDGELRLVPTYLLTGKGKA
jgi:hypothetical protein